jgi:hypothetical protein
MARAVALGAILLIAICQRGDGHALDPLRIRAMLCEKSGNDYCGKRTAKVLFEPARVRLEVLFAPHPDNKEIIYGLRCEGEEEPRAISGPYEVLPTDFLLLVEHRDIGAGTCFGVAQLARVHGEAVERINAQDGPLRILPRD